jgi:hypothetical protein
MTISRRISFRHSRTLFITSTTSPNMAPNASVKLLQVAMLWLMGRMTLVTPFAGTSTHYWDCCMVIVAKSNSSSPADSILSPHARGQTPRLSIAPSSPVVLTMTGYMSLIRRTHASLSQIRNGTTRDKFSGATPSPVGTRYPTPRMISLLMASLPSRSQVKLIGIPGSQSSLKL